MKILICTGIYPPDIGGPATYSKLLKDELPKYGFEVDVLSFGEVRGFPKIIRHIIYFFKVLKRGADTEVIYAQDPVSVGLPSVLAARILNKKFLLKIVGDYAWEQHCQRSKASLKFPISNFQFPNLEEFQRKKFDFLTEIRRSVQKWTTERADKIVVPSKYLKNIIKQWGVKEEKIYVIYNSLEGDIVNAKKSRQKVEDPRFQKESGENIIFSAGRLVPWKGFELLIEIIKELPVNFKLFIAGSGPKETDLKLKIKDLKLGDRVVLLGSLDQDQMRHYFSLAKAFVLNTSYEGLSHIILEAMQNSVPVITTNVGGNPELIKNNFNGLLVEYNNKNELKDVILKVMNDDSLQNKFIENSHKELEKFSKEKMLNSFSELIKTLCHSRPRCSSRVNCSGNPDSP